MNIFNCNDLSASYRSKQVLHNLNLAQEEGSILGLLGQNGAGKTTTIKLLMGFIKPKTGDVRILNGKAGAIDVLKKIGFAPEEGEIPDYLNASEYLDFISRFRIEDNQKRKEAIAFWLDFFELDPKKTVKAYSKGMGRRLILAQAFLGDPEFLILDEPINGLDPLLVIKLRDKLLELRSKKVSILYSSHLLSEIEKCCSQIAILEKGKLVFNNTLEACLAQFGSVEKAFVTLNAGSK